MGAPVDRTEYMCVSVTDRYSMGVPVDRRECECVFVSILEPASLNLEKGLVKGDGR